MDLSIHVRGGALAQDRKPFSRRNRPARPPPENVVEQAPVEQVTFDAWLPEQPRAQIAGIHQAIQAVETASAISTAALSALAEVGRWLTVIDGEIFQGFQAPPKSKEGEGDRSDRFTRHKALEHARKQINWIAESASFGKLRLLDGSLGCAGIAFGQGLARR